MIHPAPAPASAHPTAQRSAWRLPSQCEVCRAWGSDRLCASCSASFAPPALRCRRCALRLPNAGGACIACLRDPPPFERAICVADYGFPWDRLIAAFKFQGGADLAGTLSQRMVQAIRAQAQPGVPASDLVLPVPLAAGRLAERGYNQAWELARRVARQLGLPARSDLLLRPVETPHQAVLSRAERLANLRAAFMVDPHRRSALAGRRVALVDDVLTTGATVREASRVLLKAGAVAVEVWVVARTP